MTDAAQTPLLQALVGIVAQASREARLIGPDEVMARLREGELGNSLADEPDEELRARLDALLAARADLAHFPSLSGGEVYHVPALLSHSYARILDRKPFPVALMAEEIRLNSRDYPRPVPVELFETPPFSLPPEAISAALRAMADDPAYRDIAFTTTATGAVYLFSSLHLERRYAAFLAQRAEAVGIDP